MEIEQRTGVIVETLNEGQEGERVTLRRISSCHTDTAFSITADEARSDVYRSPDDAPAVVVEGAARS
jgi:hypothetical protein